MPPDSNVVGSERHQQDDGHEQQRRSGDDIVDPHGEAHSCPGRTLSFERCVAWAIAMLAAVPDYRRERNWSLSRRRLKKTRSASDEKR
jgi:hypothetical protein